MHHSTPQPKQHSANHHPANHHAANHHPVNHHPVNHHPAKGYSDQNTKLNEMLLDSGNVGLYLGPFTTESWAA
jgi:hypothetical protein